MYEGDTYKNWWLSPSGELHPVEHQNHLSLAADVVSGLVGKDPRANIDELYESMFNLGWIRIVLYKYLGKLILEFNLEAGKSLRSFQKDIFHVLIKEHQIDELNDATNKRWHSVFDF